MSLENLTQITDFNGTFCHKISNVICQSLATPNVLIAQTTLNTSYENPDACNLANFYGYDVFNMTFLETSFIRSQNLQIYTNLSIGGYLISECDIIRNSNFFQFWCYFTIFINIFINLFLYLKDIKNLSISVLSDDLFENVGVSRILASKLISAVLTDFSDDLILTGLTLKLYFNKTQVCYWLNFFFLNLGY